MINSGQAYTLAYDFSMRYEDLTTPKLVQEHVKRSVPSVNVYSGKASI